MTSTRSRPLAENQGSHLPAHSEGPWRADSYGVRNGGGYICQIVWPSRFHDQNERYAQEIVQRTADARLIAASPDMLAALKAMRTMMDRGPQPQKLDAALTWRECDEKARAMCDAAITKAEGASAGPPERSEAVPTPEGGRTHD